MFGLLKNSGQRPVGWQKKANYNEKFVAKQRAPTRSMGSIQDYPEVVKVPKKGIDLMNDSLYNKGVAFTYSERDRFEIRGLMPPVHTALSDQVARIKARLDDETSPIRRYLFLNSLQDRNETAFYKLLLDNIKDFAPIIYTPTVGLVAKQFGYLYRKPRGMWFSARDRGEMASMVYNWPAKNVDVIVVTDGSRILGLGDLGCNGMAIPIGKLSLYIAAGGIHPSRVLPITLDVGTNNEELLNDPFYLGLKQRRITGEAYYSLVDEFMAAVRNRWPKVLVQFEDFSNNNAYPLLHKYRREHLCFNDDIQGTGAVALAGIYAALRVQGKPPVALKDQKIVVMGAGSAGLGVVFSLYHGMIAQGLKPEEAARNFWLIDKDGLLTTARKTLAEGQKNFARPDMPEGLPLGEVIKKVKPTIMLGLSGVGGVFTEEAVREMAKNNERPIIFPLSNPTDKAECSAEQAYTWTNGRAIFASGSPFDPVVINGKTYYPSQGNNMFIYPGVGLAAVVCGAKRISVGMFAKAAEVLSTCVSEQHIAQAKVYPDVENIREVSVKIAVEVCKIAYAKDLATNPIPHNMSLEEFVRKKMYYPDYAPFVLEHEK